MEKRKVFVSDLDKKLGDLDKVLKDVTLVNDIDECTDVLVATNNMSGLFDVARAVELGKNLYLYDADGSFSKLKRDLSVGHLITDVNQLNGNEEINQMINGEDEENDRINNGKSSKLL